MTPDGPPLRRDRQHVPHDSPVRCRSFLLITLLLEASRTNTSIFASLVRRTGGWHDLIANGAAPTTRQTLRQRAPASPVRKATFQFSLPCCACGPGRAGPTLPASSCFFSCATSPCRLRSRFPCCTCRQTCLNYCWRFSRQFPRRSTLAASLFSDGWIAQHWRLE